MIELQECPFCASEASMRSMLGQRFRGYCTNDEDCGAATAFFDTEEEAAEKWNRRAQIEEEEH
jgi:hypothetical protein